jgi:hypothetical protein
VCIWRHDTQHYETQLNATQHNDNHHYNTQHNDISIMLGVVYAEYQAFCNAECHCTECHYAQCCNAECHYAVCHYAECCGAMFMTSYLYHPSLIFARYPSLHSNAFA